MTDRTVARIWAVVTSARLAVGLATALVTMFVVSVLVDQSSLGGGTPTAGLRDLLPGLLAARDLRHSLVFLGLGLALAAVLVLIAADRMLSQQAVGLDWAAGVLLRLAVAATLLLLLAQLFLTREVVVPLVPEETVLLPSLDASIRARVTGWRPAEGTFGTVELAPRLAGSELAGPFGDQDRPPEAALAPDAVEMELTAEGPGVAHGLAVRVTEQPPAWAARVRITWQGVDVSSPYLETGQTWRAAALPLDPAPVLTVDRVVPAFDPSEPLGRQPLGGPAVAPAAVLTLHQGEEVLGSRALAPGESVVFGDVVLSVEGFAPVLEASVSRSAYDRLSAWTVAAAVLAVLSGLVLAVGVVRRSGKAES